jgi:hypothetical protein
VPQPANTPWTTGTIVSQTGRGSAIKARLSFFSSACRDAYRLAMTPADEWDLSDLSDLSESDADVDQLAQDDGADSEEDGDDAYRAPAPRKPKAPAKATKSLLRPPRTSQYPAESLYSASYASIDSACDR